MILAVLGEAACRRVEVAAIERFVELLGDAPIDLDNVQGSPPCGSVGWQRFYLAYQSDCGDHRLHERHRVSVHWCRHAGQTPPGVEGIPFETALAEPVILFARRPTAEWATDARRFRSVGLLLLLNLAVWNDHRIVSNRTHASTPPCLTHAGEYTRKCVQS